VTTSFARCGQLLALLLAAVFSLTCRAEGPAPAPRPAHWATSLKTDFNLHQVDGKLYRSALPDADDVAQLKSLGIVTVINLYQKSDQNWIAGSGMQEIHMPMRTRWFNDSDAIAALRAIRSAQASGPVLVHCKHGQNRTGLVTALYRMVYQGWSKEQALTEMQQGFGGASEKRMEHALDYLEDVDTDELRVALESGACSTSALSWCNVKGWLSFNP